MTTDADRQAVPQPTADKPPESTEFRTDLPSQRRINQVVQPEPVPLEGEDAGQAEVTDKMNDALAKGYVGIVTDPTPNENYTVQGVTSGAERPDAQAEPMSPGERPNA